MNRKTFRESERMINYFRNLKYFLNKEINKSYFLKNEMGGYTKSITK